MVVVLFLSIQAILRGGYVGPDYPMHLQRVIEWKRAFDFSATNPPLYFLFGHLFFVLFGSTNSFPIALSITQVVLNLVALVFFFRHIRPRFGSAIMYSAFCLFLIFLPVRVIHAATISADSMTVPLFVPLLVLADKVTDEKPAYGVAMLMGLALGIAVWTKYSFMAILPVLFVVFVFSWVRGQWQFRQFLAICFLGLGLASALSIHSVWASSKVHGYNTEKHWKQDGVPPDMTYPDLLWIKANDLQLFRAPEYFKKEILRPHQHSYLGLSHLGVFTDTMNLFQELSVPQNVGRVLIPDQKTRRPWKTPVMSASMSLGIAWTISALAGTAWLLFESLKKILKGRLEREQVMILLGVAYFLLLFLPIPFVHAGALFGYWTPRLILPALISFFLAGFLLIDRKVATQSYPVAVTVFSLVIFQSLLDALILV